MDNITYLLGAGASYNSCPIWKEQAEKMVELPKLMNYNFLYKEAEGRRLSDVDYIVWLIGYVGTKALEFNTVDTYAKKLFLQGRKDDLNKLKAAVSSFFTIWSLTNSSKWKYRLINGEKVNYENIDHRYVNLLATYLEKSSEHPKLRDNVKFVTWNYDLQIESAYKKFTDIINYSDVDKHLPFKPESPAKKLDICHLNGYHGLIKHPKAELVLDSKITSDYKSIIENLAKIIVPDLKENMISFSNNISYAWEPDSEIAKVTRLKAQQIFEKTDFLVVIGYSFPPFNYEIDKELFNNFKKTNRIIIQDPNADSRYIAETFGLIEKNISVVDKVEQFVIPNYTSPPPRTMRLQKW